MSGSISGRGRTVTTADSNGRMSRSAASPRRAADLTDPTATLALCRWLKNRIADWEAEAKRSLGLLAGERKAAVVAGQVIGHVTMTKGRKSARVANETALLAYVKAHHPTEVETLEQIRPAFLKQLLDDAQKKGAMVDSDGVVIDGLIDVVEGDGYPMSKLAEDADIVVASLLSRGQLGVNGLKELPPEPTDRWTQDEAAGAIG
jgi:hypothetical protein